MRDKPFSHFQQHSLFQMSHVMLIVFATIQKDPLFMELAKSNSKTEIEVTDKATGCDVDR